MPEISTTHLILVPSYNTGPVLLATLTRLCRAWSPVWVVIDGSDDGSGEELQRRQGDFPGLCILALPENSGKGAAILHGARAAEAAGFTHVLTMDADGQHDSASIAAFMTASRADPASPVFGQPVFDASAPWERVAFRKLSNICARALTKGACNGDSLFGMRVYPLRDLIAVMEETAWARRFDFDAEVAVRLCWRGLEPIDLPTPVRYFSSSQGGVSHFHYFRDNLLLGWMYLRLAVGSIHLQR